MDLYFLVLSINQNKLIYIYIYIYIFKIKCAARVVQFVCGYLLVAALHLKLFLHYNHSHNLDTKTLLHHFKTVYSVPISI